VPFKWNIPPERLFNERIARHGFTTEHTAQKWGQLIRKFVPKDGGRLSSARVIRAGNNKAYLHYAGPYARRQYYGTRSADGGITKHEFLRIKHPLATHKWHEAGIKAGLFNRLLDEVRTIIREGMVAGGRLNGMRWRHE